MVQPNGVLNDQCGKAVAVGFGIGHGRSAYPDPVKATQPFQDLCTQLFTLMGEGGKSLLGRIPYSGLMLTIGFASALICAFILNQIAAAGARQRFYVVPAGDYSVMQADPYVEWLPLTECRLPVGDDDTPIVADLHFDHPDEWERLLADAAISGRAVYHTRALKESLTGKVEIKHLSENSFGSLLPNLAYRKIKRLTDIAGSAIALLVLAPETMAAIRAAAANQLQISMNLAFGSAMASIGLTVPVIAVASLFLDVRLVLGLDPADVVLLALTVVTASITLQHGRVTVMQGAIHLTTFAAFIFLAVVP